MKFLGFALGGVALLVGAVALFVYAGVYNVAASEPHHRATAWFLHTVTTQSVRARAEAEPPTDLDDPERVQRGAGRYGVLCVTCHGAPGVEPSDIGTGLLPEPPELGDVVSYWSDAELHWILEHGVKFTGMPGFGATQDDERLWDLVAFVRKLPGMTPEAYRELGTAF